MESIEGRVALTEAQNTPRPRKYILVDGVPWPEADEKRWAEWFERSTEERQIGFNEFSGVRVSTVFLGLDHSYGSGEPLLYETMIFGGEFDRDQQRCSTREQALAQHERAVQQVQASQQRPDLRRNRPGKRNRAMQARRCAKNKAKKLAKQQAKQVRTVPHQDILGDLAGVIQHRRNRGTGRS